MRLASAVCTAQDISVAPRDGLGVLELFSLPLGHLRDLLDLFL